MDASTRLSNRLGTVNPGWDDWNRLIALVKSLSFEYVTDDYIGKFYTSGHPLTFSELDNPTRWPGWLPAYVPVLYGMKADGWDAAGGYADSFYNEPAKQGFLFSPAGNDEALGFPLIEVPDDVYSFQSNASGALFFINKKLDVLFPNSDDRCFEKMDTLEEFTRKNIQEVVQRRRWFEAYHGLKVALLD